MKTNELISRVQSLYSKGLKSDDTRLESRLIFNKLLSSRSKLVSQRARKRQFISKFNYQTLPCVELIKAPIAECPCLPPIGCDIYRTKYPIPSILTDLNYHLIDSVTTLNGNIVFSEITWNEKKYKSSNKYTANKPDYFIRNGYIYVTQKKGAKVITITGLFENPWEAEKFPSICDDCEDCGCQSPLDMEFPIDNDMVDTLVELATKELVVMFSQSIEDVSNNTRDTQNEQSK